MKLTIYNNENCVAEKAGSCIFRVCRNNYCTITGAGLKLLGLGMGDRVVVANDEDTKSWYIRKVNGAEGFQLRGISSSIGFKNAAFNEIIVRKLRIEGTMGFLIAREPVEIDGEKYFRLITTRPIKQEIRKSGIKS